MSHPPRASAPLPKTMSSRLLTMKFMQRAAASPTSTSPQTLLDNPQTPPAKRQKIITPSSAPAPLSDLQAVKEALKAEEDRRVEALDRLAAVAGETKWVLSCVDGGEAEGKGARSLRVLTTGYSEIDRGDFNVNSGHGHEGRRRFGKFNYKLEKSQTGTADETFLTSEDEADAPDSEDPTGANELIRNSRDLVIQQAKSNHNADTRTKDAEAAQFGEIAKRGEVNLNRLSSISGGGGVKSGRSDRGAYGNAAQKRSARR